VSTTVRDIERLAGLWHGAARAVVLTGAGLSTASGIPDFRSPGGRWERYQPVLYQDFLAREDARRDYWRYKGQTWPIISRAEPNPAHMALAALACCGHIELLVTQNVDGLHERSGFPPERLVNIHGTDSRIRCVACGAEEAREVGQRQWEAGVPVPQCGCGGAWKPKTISFGQGLAAHDLARAMQSATACDVFVAVGTSLVVSPINGMFDAACASGAATAILTASETPADTRCSLKISDPVERVLPCLARLICGRAAPGPAPSGRATPTSG
jgi:NAD-dependent protein deacetylase/lipoamidase